MQPNPYQHYYEPHPSQAALDARTAALVATGARVTHSGYGWIQLEKGRPYNRSAHGVMAFFTFGLSLPFSLMVYAFGGVRRILLSAMPDGSIDVYKKRA
jgi:hypothetical protein